MNSTLAIGVGYRPEFMSADRRPLPRDDLPAGWWPYCSMPKEGALDALSACSDAMRLHENWKPVPRIPKGCLAFNDGSNNYIHLTLVDNSCGRGC